MRKLADPSPKMLPSQGGGTPILDLTGCVVLLNRVSFYRKNHATGCPFLTRIMQQGIKIDKKKICDRVSC